MVYTHTRRTFIPRDKGAVFAIVCNLKLFLGSLASTKELCQIILVKYEQSQVSARAGYAGLIGANNYSLKGETHLQVMGTVSTTTDQVYGAGRTR